MERKAVIDVQGMTCQSCVRNIETNISKVKGIKLIKVILENKEALVNYNPEDITPGKIADMIDDMGFPAKVKDSVTVTLDEKGDNCAETIVLIEGMVCMSCVRNIEGNISSKPSIISISVSLEKKQAVVTFDPTKQTAQQVADAIDDMGFEAKLPERKPGMLIGRIHIEGMTCQSCVRNIEANMAEKAGVKEIRVSLSDKEAFIVYDPESTDIETLREQVDEMGFEASLPVDVMLGEEFDKLASRSSSVSGKSEAEEVCVIGIEGMTCQSCVRNIQSNISSKTGIKNIEVSLAGKNGVVKYDPKMTNPAAIADAIDDMGFEAKVLKGKISRNSSQASDVWKAQETATVDIGVKGMTCNSCVKTIEGKLGEHIGIKSVKVSLADEKAVIEYYVQGVTPRQLQEAIDDMGFEASLLDVGKKTPRSIRRSASEEDFEKGAAVLEMRMENGRNSVRFTKKSLPLDDDDIDKCFLRITGMTCASCVATIERNLLKVEGIKNVLVALMAQKAEVKYDPAYILPSQIANKVTDLGFNASVLEAASQGQSTVELTITGMTCASCVHLIESKKKKVPTATLR